MKQKLQNEDIQIREMSPKDIPAMLNMVKAVGWNQTEKDLKIFLEDKSNVNYAAEIGGRLVGTVASANYDRKIAWISMMIVQEAYRGRGIGKILMQTIIRRLKLDGADSIKLDATPAGKLVYSKLGFKEEYAIYRLVHPSPDNLSLSIAAQISFLDSQNLEAVSALDGAVFGAGRKQLIQALIENFPHRSLAINKQDQIEALALGREGLRYNQIGPLFADNLQDAQSLFAAALKGQSGRTVVVDVPVDKKAFAAWLKALGFQYQRPLYRMYLRHNPYPGDINRQYLICGPEFG